MERLRALRQAAVRYVHKLRRFKSLFTRLEGEWFSLSPLAFARRLAIFSVQHRRLADFFHQPAHPVLREVKLANPQIRYKMFLLYRRVGLSIEQRVDLLIEHYDLARTLFGEALFRAAQINPEGFVLCHVRLPGGHGVLPVRLTRYQRAWREGELSIGLYDPFGTLIYSLTFSLFRGDGGGMFIGSLIGRSPPENIKHLTKLMQGLRPQNLMLFLAQALCRYYSLASLLAVGRDAHVFASSSLKERLRFGYDDFWQEQGGQPLPGDPAIYRLPTHPERRPESDIPSHKRAQYRRRYAFMDDVEADLRERLKSAG